MNITTNYPEKKEKKNIHQMKKKGKATLIGGEIERYGADGEVGDYVVNNDHTCDYGELENATDVEVYKAFGVEQMSRKFKGKSKRTFKDFANKIKSPGGWGK